MMSRKHITMIAALCLIMAAAIAFGITYYNIKSEKEGKVYISLGKNANCYHKTRHCQGLRYSKRVIKVDAIIADGEYGRRPCKICYHIDPLYDNYGD